MIEQTPKSSRWRLALSALVLVAAAVGIGWSIGRFRQDPVPVSVSGASKRGALLYRTSCANCHGAEGRGDGDSASTLRPRPRDFAARPWRFEPTKASIRRVIVDGVPGTAMPANQGSLTDGDVDLLVEHVYELATARPPVPYEPSADEALVKAAGLINLLGATPPPLTVFDAMGRPTTLADLRGRLVIVQFWGTTCVHCLQDMPALRKLAAERGPRGLTILHVCADAVTPKEAQALLDKHSPGLEALTDETGLALARFEVQTLPNVWLIGPDGKAIGRATGAVDWRSPPLAQLIDRWLPRSEK